MIIRKIKKKRKKKLKKNNFKTKKKLKGGSDARNPLSKEDYQTFQKMLEKTVELFDGVLYDNLYNDDGSLKENIITYKNRFLANTLNRGNGLIPFNDPNAEIAGILNGIDQFPQEKDLVKRGIYFTRSYVIKEHSDILGSNPDRVRDILDKIKELTSIVTFQALCTYRFIEYTDYGEQKYATIMPKGVDVVDYLNSTVSFSLEKILQFCTDLTDTIMKLCDNDLYYIDLKLENIAVFNENGENNLYLIDIDSIVTPTTKGKITYCSKNLYNKPLSQSYDKKILYLLYGLYVTIFMLIYFSKDIVEDYKVECDELDKLLFEQSHDSRIPGSEDDQFVKYINNGKRSRYYKPPNGIFVLEHPNLRKLNKVSNTIENFLDFIKPFFSSRHEEIPNYNKKTAITICENLKNCLIIDLGNL